MKRMWLYVAVAIVVGVLILGATKDKCGKAKKIPDVSERERDLFP